MICDETLLLMWNSPPTSQNEQAEAKFWYPLWNPKTNQNCKLSRMAGARLLLEAPYHTQKISFM